MSEIVTEVTDGKLAIPSDSLMGGESYRLTDNGNGQFYMSHVPRRDDDGSRNILMLEDGYTSLQRFSHEMARGSMGYRPEYTLALSGLMVWALEDERRDHAIQLVQDYGQAIYRGEKTGRTEANRFIRLYRDAVTAVNQFASSMSHVLGGMNPEKTIVLTALTIWAVEQEDAPDVVDEYGEQMYANRRAERQRMRAESKGKQSRNEDDSADLPDDETVLNADANGKS